MNNWMITSQLRIVKKDKWGEDSDGIYSISRRVLQQKWLKPIYDDDGHKCDYEYEWRDVPVVDEE